MRFTFINQMTESHELVVFFNGWGMDEHVFAQWPKPSFNLLEIHDFCDFSNIDSLKKALEPYNNVIVLAWSMGVWAYTRIWKDLGLPVERAIAINGTPNPIHDDWGITLDVYQATLDNFSEVNRNKFLRRMCDSKAVFEDLQSHLAERNAEDQRQELLSIQQLALSEKEHWHHPFHACVISEKDLIIPSNNQKNYWNGRAEVIDIPGGHYPFYQWNSWEEMLERLFQT